MTHLTPDELIDAVDDRLDASRRPHLDACAECRQEASALRAALQTARQVGVPEPSPLFWEHFSERVRRAIDAEAPATPGWRNWLRWPVLAPLAALALVLIAIQPLVPPAGPASPAPAAVAAVAPAGDVVLAADGWQVVAGLVGPIDWDTAGAVGLVLVPGAAERAVEDLSADERAELLRLLTEELERSAS